jgi:acyl-CoA thioester hydrolase
MNNTESLFQFRVRYSEVDKLGTFYNSRALEWFEWGRVELMRKLGIPYADMEAKGFFLPLIEAHLDYLGRASFDDLLTIQTRMSMSGKARVRFDMLIVQTPACNGCDVPLDDCRKVVRGHTVHAVTDQNGRPVRPPEWFVQAIENAKGQV